MRPSQRLAEPVRAADGVWMIELPTPFAVGPVNAVLIEGEPLTLVDCGPHTDEAWVALREGLARCGHRVDELAKLVLTHQHIDHSGQSARVARASRGERGEVVVHPKTAAWLTPAALLGRQGFVASLLTEHGAPAPVAACVRAFLEGSQPAFQPAVPTAFVVEGDRLRAGGRDWVVLETPGHSVDHICLWQPEQRVLIAGDHLLPEISSNALVDPEEPGAVAPSRSLPRYLASLRRVDALDCRVVVPGHGGLIRDHYGLIAERLEKVERRAEAILEALESGPRTASELAGSLFPRLRPWESFLALSEVLGHLFLLEDRHLVTGDLRGEVRWYRRREDGARGVRAQPPGADGWGERKGGERSVDVASIFAALARRIADNPDKIAGLTAAYQFDFTGEGGGTYHADIKGGEAEIGPGALPEPGCTIVMQASDFIDMVGGKLSPMSAFMSGKLKVKGDLGLAMKLQSLLG